MNQPPPSAVFTVRDLNRQPAKVLDAVRTFGSVEIRSRSGEVFTIVMKASEKARPREFPNFQSRWKKLREVGLVPPSRSDNQRLNRIIAGEE
jgi:hypothetical protein